jgi:AraC-like DNA-binding protein
MPGSHLSVGTLDRAGRLLDPAGARVYGVLRRLDERRLVGRGWTVAAKTSGGLGVLTGRPAHTLTGSELPMDDAFGVVGVAAIVEGAGDDGDDVESAGVAGVDDGGNLAAGIERARVAALRGVLERVVATRPPQLLAQAREVTAVAAVAEHDRSVVRVEQLAATAGVGVRTLQRMFSVHLGVSPAWVIRRWRIVEAADRAAAGHDVRWSGLAADLGYADQAHLVRDFRAHLGTTPAAYTRALSTASTSR